VINMVNEKIEVLKKKLDGNNKINLIRNGFQVVDEDDDEIIYAKQVRRGWLLALAIIGIPITAAIISVPAFIAWLVCKKTEVRVVQK